MTKLNINELQTIYSMEGHDIIEQQLQEAGVVNIDEVIELVAIWNREYDKLDCEEEGFNKKQQEEADKLDKKYTKEIVETIKYEK